MVSFYSLISVVIVSLISLIGVFTLSWKPERLKKISLFLVSFAVGGLFGDAILHLLPESFEKLRNNILTSLLVISGIIVFFSLEKFLRWRHCHTEDCDAHLPSVATMSLAGDAVHNFIDGLLVAASYAASFPIGLATTLAVIFHEIPQEIGNFGVLVHSGYSVKKALFFNFLSALTAVLGAIVSLIIGSSQELFASLLLPLAAGGFLYLAGSDLLPELHHDTRPKSSLIQLFFIILGVAIMALLAFLG